MDELQFAIIHSLDKAAGSAAASIRTRDSVLDIDKPAVRSLAEQLAKLVGKDGSSVFWGQFGTNRREGLFPSSVQSLLGGCTEEAFIASSHVAMRELESKACEENFATGGHICFIAYRIQATDFLLVAMIKERSGMVLSADLEPTQITEIDLSKLHQAARVNLDRYRSVLAQASGESPVADDQPEAAEEKTYLCFVNRKSQSDVADYFVEALGCEKGVASGRATKAVVSEVYRFVKSVAEIRDKASAARMAVIDYMCEQGDGTLVTLDTIAAVVRHTVGVDYERHVDGLKDHLNSDGVQIPDEFPLSAKVLRSYTRIVGKGPRWQLSFENGALGVGEGEIIYNPQEQSVTVTHLPQGMVRQIEAALAARAMLPGDEDR